MCGSGTRGLFANRIKNVLWFTINMTYISSFYEGTKSEHITLFLEVFCNHCDCLLARLQNMLELHRFYHMDRETTRFTKILEYPISLCYFLILNKYLLSYTCGIIAKLLLPCISSALILLQCQYSEMRIRNIYSIFMKMY